MTVKRVFGGGESGGKEVDKWIKDIRDLHRSKPNPSVQYSRTMPDIDPLMQVSMLRILPHPFLRTMNGKYL